MIYIFKEGNHMSRGHSYVQVIVFVETETARGGWAL